MEFLTPNAIAIAGGLTLPPLIALYFLKLKRQVIPVSSTLLWLKAIEDLHVNAPFQRLRNSLLLWLQLLVLLLAALALGRPMFLTTQKHEKSLILLIDQSASMSVVEDNRQTRLDVAKEEAKKVVAAMDDSARAMVIAFCDRATMVSSFDTDKEALARKIDSIDPTDSTSRLSEAITLAEAYSQNIIIGSSSGTDVGPQSAAGESSVFLFTDGRIEDANDVSPQRLDLAKMQVIRIGKRTDNVGIIAMDARRQYEKPEILQVFSTVRNFGPDPVTLDVTLFIDNQHADVKTITLTSGSSGETEMATQDDTESDVPAVTESPHDAPPPGSVVAIAFDDIELSEGAIIEVRLKIDDALPADNRAYSVVPSPKNVDVLLITRGNHLLERTLATLRINAVKMTPEEYENASEDLIVEAGRSRFSLVMFDDHSTARLPPGNYMFWGSAPQIDGVEELGIVENEIMIDWDAAHPVLRHASIANLEIFYHWKRLKLPPDAIRLIEGETDTSTVLSYFSSDGRQFLVCAFSIFVISDDGQPVLNTNWIMRWDWVSFLSDAIQFLASATQTENLKSLRPGDPATTPIDQRTETVQISRPDGRTDDIPTGGAPSVTYARTRSIGTYKVTPAETGQGIFAVNLYSSAESDVTPQKQVSIGSSTIAVSEGQAEVNEPVWTWFLLAALVIMMLEWIVYNRRVFV